jgi:GDP-4-dehydro-6-deoxy-D-mannose reductase
VRVLVTGSSGFVGPWLVAHLAACGDEVVELDPSVDVTDLTALRAAMDKAEPEAVCHLAAQASVARSWEDPAGTYAVNTLGTLHLCQAASELAERPRVLLVASAEVYGTVRPEDLPITEDHPYAPNNPYSASKAAAELVGLQAWLGRGLPVIRVRPFNHTGPGQTTQFAVPSFAAQVVAAARGGADHLDVGNLTARRDLSDVRDVVRAYRLLLERGEPGQAYNVCRGQSVMMEEVMRRLLEMAGVDAPLRLDPSRVRPVDIPDLVGDPTRLRVATGWEPEMSLDRTLADVLEAAQRQAASSLD